MSFFAVLVVLMGASAIDARASGPFVVLKFVDRHVSVFVLAEGNLSNFRTKGTGVEVVADCGKHTIEISGAGEVIYKTNRIDFSGRGIVINGKALPSEGKNFVLSPSGEVQEGFVRTFDREPHKR
jgi:hypothetical protein